MDQPTLRSLWNQMRQKYGVYLRLLETFPEDRLHRSPVEAMRSPAEMVVHTSGSIVRDIAQGVAKGEIAAREDQEADIAGGLEGKEDVLGFARRCWDEADQAVRRIDEDKLNAMVPTAWDMTFPGYVAFAIMNDEFLHHRGQLYAYARLFGQEPPFLWGYGDNPEGFRPEA